MVLGPPLGGNFVVGLSLLGGVQTTYLTPRAHLYEPTLGPAGPTTNQYFYSNPLANPIPMFRSPSKHVSLKS